MSIQARLMDDLKQALRDQDATRKGAIRMALAAIKNARVAKNADLTDTDVIVVLSKEVKQCRDAMAEFDAAGRTDDAPRIDGRERPLSSGVAPAAHPAPACLRVSHDMRQSPPAPGRVSISPIPAPQARNRRKAPRLGK